MVTLKELEMVEYLLQQPVVADNSITVNKGIIKQALTFLLENKIEILGLSFLMISDNSISKMKHGNISYKEEVSLETMLKDITEISENFSHIEISVLFKEKS